MGHLLRLSRPAKRAITVAVDLCMVPIALWSAITLRLAGFDHGGRTSPWLYLIAAVSSVLIFARCGLYRAVLRFIAARATFAVLAGVTASVLFTALADRFFLAGRLRWSTYVIYFLIATLYVGGSRLLITLLLEAFRKPADSRAIIFGAGDGGAKLAMALKKSDEVKPVAFVDDDVSLHGSVVQGLEVFPPERLPSLIHRLDASRVLLAVPSLSRAKRREIIARLEPLDIHVQTVPALSDIAAGRARVDDVQDIDVTDLLGRDSVAPDACLLEACVKGKVVMVTGAGGSIGSELCRQILRLRPLRLVLIEMSEHALYSIDSELRAEAKRLRIGTELVALLGNAHHKHRVREVMQTFHVQTVYHAAAYKHVPIVESNIAEGVHNNVIATLHTAEAARETGVETFVLVSTDKAVKPTNVMGATKRLAELVLQGLHNDGSPTRFCMVRFGNVLDSSGSVVPLFREQIRGGGPVTVTHADVTRYFMTIPEAAQLVIQASAMARGGDVFVLDMGQPVRIDDLARRMINLMGLTVKDESHPDGDIAVVYTGLRPGEKLHEELLIGSNVSGTEHPMIMRALEHSLPWSRVSGIIEDLRTSVRNFECGRTLRVLEEAVVEYSRAPALADLVAVRRAELGVDVVHASGFEDRRRPVVQAASVN